MNWFDEKSTLKLQAGDDSRAAKLDQKINAKSSIGARLDAKIAALQARLEALDNAVQPAQYAGGAFAFAA